MRVLTRREELLSQARRHPEAVVDQLLTSEQQVKALLEKVRTSVSSHFLNFRVCAVRRADWTRGSSYPKWVNGICLRCKTLIYSDLCNLLFLGAGGAISGFVR